MTDLIRRLEEAKEGSRELDSAFAVAIRCDDSQADTPGKIWIPGCGSINSQTLTVRHYTTNLQDAVSAVPEGLDYTLQSRNCYALLADWSSGTSGVPKGTAMAKTLPVALCIAIIRAMEAKNE